MLLLTVGMLNPVLATRRATRSIAAIVIHVMGCIAATVLFALALRDVALIDGLVHIAIRGIEMAASPPYDLNFYPGGVPRYETTVQTVTTVAIAFACTAVLNVGFLIYAASRKDQRVGIGGYVVTALAAGAAATWLRWVGFEAVSPMIASIRSFWLVDVWYVALPLIALFVLAASRRLVGCSACEADCLTWRPKGKVYHSECWPLLLALPIATILPPVVELWQFARVWNAVWAGFGRFKDIGIVFHVFEEPSFYLNLAVACSALYVARLRIARKSLPGAVLPQFSYGSLIATCIGVLLSLYFVVEATIWCSFMHSISPY